MSGISRLLRDPGLRPVLIALIATASVYAISAFTGLGDWIDATPPAIVAFRVLGLLFWSAMGLGSWLHGRLEYRVIGVLFLLFAAVNAVLLIAGENALGFQP